MNKLPKNKTEKEFDSLVKIEATVRIKFSKLKKLFKRRWLVGRR